MPKLNVHIGKLSGVHIERIDLDIDFLDLAACFIHMPGTVVLLSGGNQDCSRYHIMGALPWLTVSADTKQTNVTINQQNHTFDSNPFKILRLILIIDQLAPRLLSVFYSAQVLE